MAVRPNAPPGRARAVSGYLFLAGLLVLWEVLARSGAFPGDLLPPVTGILREGMKLTLSLELPRQAAVSLGRILCAFALGGVLGAVFGFGCGVFPRLKQATGLTTEFLRPMPSVALIPIGILLLGIGTALNVAIAAFACAWPVYVSALAGSKAAGATLIDTARCLGRGRARVLWEVVAPAALPATFAGLRVALGVAVAVTVITEMAASPNGLGSLVLSASLSRQAPRMYAGIVAIGLVGFGVNALFAVVRRAALAWLPAEARP